MPTQEWIRDLLKDKGHKLKDVAAALHIAAPRVTDILKGAREVQADEIIPLANLLGLSTHALLESLSAGTLKESADNIGARYLKIQGKLMGDGTIEPLVDAEEPNRVAVPPDAETLEGLMAFKLGDNVLEQEIKPGSMIITGDPRLHHYPMVPGAIFLIRQPAIREAGNSPNDTDDSLMGDRLVPRQYYRSDTGDNWLIPLTERPNPAFESWRFALTPRPGGNNDAPHTASTETSTAKTVYIDDIAAAVMWVHQRYRPS